MAGVEETEEADPNVPGVMWKVKAWWEDRGVLCTQRVAASQNGGRPIICRRTTSEDGRRLVVTQEWAPGKVFTQSLEKRA